MPWASRIPRSMSSSTSFTTRVDVDCAFRLVIRYSLQKPFSRAMLAELERIGGYAPAITAFSQHVPGALDLFQIPLSATSFVQGLIGGTQLVATFGKLGERTAETLDDFGELPPLRDRVVLEEILAHSETDLIPSLDPETA